MDSVRMVRRYNERLIPERVKEDITARLPSMTSRFTNWTVYQADLVAKVKALIGTTATAASIQVQQYCAFALEVARIQNTHSGSVVAGEVALALAKWKARGLTEATLILLRDNLFSISAPVAP